MHIAVSGNIGCGKTTLTKMLAKHYGWEAVFEPVDNNPYLADFYEDMTRWAFHLQIYFLHSRFEQVNLIINNKKSTVQDRTIYEDAYIFAANLYESGYLEKRDYESYLSLFKTMMAYVQPPDLLIYLKGDVSTLVAQIEKRGRDFESGMRLDYLKSLNQKYESWVSDYKESKLLTININDLDIVSNREHFSFIVEQIDRELHGLFS
ncbi:deoxynucleoside kinase [Pleomorphovibrio marinus]|uniref:deoxynucleoside kinase n=1 Tax=Pleomorphovibrio marinus TaxID=2164132 RepID=UPI000E0C289B|nr:deoxynucleoside kinase [Pleomorphovibrio marinus]